MIRAILSVFILSLNFSCITRNDDRPTVHTVMVVDSGFDTSLEVFKGKIEATYTLKCEGVSCNVLDGFEPDTLQDSSILPLKDKWNQAIKTRDYSQLSIEELQKIESVLESSHGTATASIIAYKNPNVRLVLVKNIGEIFIPEDCRDDQNREKYKSYLNFIKNNWEVNSKLEHAQEKAIYQLAVKHQVDLINKSYGNIGPDQYVRTLFGTLQGCPELAELIIASSRLQAEQKHNMGIYKNSPFLTLQSAGNERTRIDSYNDTPQCAVKGDNHLYVGAYDAFNKVSNFSNYGACVDFYILGTKVITASPGGFLMPLDGTSYSSPLAVRLITEGFQSTAPKAIKAYISNNTDSRKFLRINKKHLEDIAYDFGVGKNAFGLTSNREPKFADFDKKFEDNEQKYNVTRAINYAKALSLKK